MAVRRAMLVNVRRYFRNPPQEDRNYFKDAVLVLNPMDTTKKQAVDKLSEIESTADGNDLTKLVNIHK